MEYLIGIVLALAISVSATYIGFDRDRAFYPTILVVIASYYALFAVMDGSINVLIIESVFIAAFFYAAVLGFKHNLWFIVGALLIHGVFDFFHHHISHNPGVPTWWPMFCLSYDGMAAGYLAWLLKKSRLAAKML